MTETAPDAAVRIALGRVSGHEYSAVARDVVDALARADMLCPPGPLAEVERLRAAARDVAQARKKWPSGNLEGAIDALETTLDTAPAGTTADRVLRIGDRVPVFMSGAGELIGCLTTFGNATGPLVVSIEPFPVDGEPSGD